MQINLVDNSSLRCVSAQQADVMVTAIRDTLRKAPDNWRLGKAMNAFLVEQLPAEWRVLVRVYGRVPVFQLLAANFTLSEAQEQLNGTV
jgi:hypothetical protein